MIDAAQRYKIKAVGIEYNPDLVALARRHAVRAGVQDRATFIHGDIFIEDFSQASVLALYLLPDLNLKLKPTILAMRPGTRVVSNTFNMGSWPADATIELDSGNRANYWVVPAKVQGRWQMDDARGDAIAELDLRQEFQLLQGTVRFNGETCRFSPAGCWARPSTSPTAPEQQAAPSPKEPSRDLLRRVGFKACSTIRPDSAP